MVKRINRTVIIIIVFVALFITGNQIALRQYDISTDKILLENLEMHTLQEFKLSLERLQIAYLESKNTNVGTPVPDSLMTWVGQMKNNCEKFVTEKHMGDQWAILITHYQSIIDLGRTNESNYEYKIEKAAIKKMLFILDKMVQETEDEIQRAMERNNTLHKHSTITLLSVGAIFIIVISYLSIRTARSIANPISSFLSTFKKLGSGYRNIRVEIETKDEFGILATEFNTMFDELDKTTITLEYFRNIIDNIYGSLFVTDLNGTILSCNLAVEKLLGYNEDQLRNTSILKLFNLVENEKSAPLAGESLKKVLKNLERIELEDGDTLHVLTTCTSFDTQGKKGLIVVIHDISEKIEYQQRLEESKRKNMLAINDAQEAERIRIATELHDSLGQKLSAIFYALQNKSDFHDEDNLTEIQQLVNEAITETRTISHSIMPGVLKDFGLIAALNELIESTNKLQVITCSFNHFDFDERPDPTIEKILYRVCQEALNNTLKHAKATHVVFQLFKSPKLITLMIEDDGIGFDLDALESQPHNGIGLLSIKERVAHYNGEVTINSSTNKGTEIIVEIPYRS